MADLALFDIVEADPAEVRPAAPATDVRPDPFSRGHVVVYVDGQEGWPLFLDLGSVLQIQSGRGAQLSFVQARDLGRALVAVADRKLDPAATEATQGVLTAALASPFLVEHVSADAIPSIVRVLLAAGVRVAS